LISPTREARGEIPGDGGTDRLRLRLTVDRSWM